jgi:hypothetical protein
MGVAREGGGGVVVLVPGGVTVRGCKFDNEAGSPFFKECQGMYCLELLLWAT